MYAGHFAVGLALKARSPRTPTWAILLATGFLDVLFGIFVLLGVERTTITPGRPPGFTLDFIDWSHSLAMSLVWAVLFAAAFVRRGRAIALVLGFAVFSHFLLDLPMHPHDLALWPGSQVHLGLALWHTPYWWWVELAFIGAACAYYLVRARALRSFGGRAGWAIAVVVALHLFNSPWFSPT
jgi:hypothetical protein